MLGSSIVGSSRRGTGTALSGLIPEINDVVAARGAGAAGTSGIGATDSFGPL